MRRDARRRASEIENDVRTGDANLYGVMVSQADGVRVLDDRSLNGIYVNGQRVSEAALHDGDWIAIGHVSLRYVEVTGG